MELEEFSFQVNTEPSGHQALEAINYITEAGDEEDLERYVLQFLETRVEKLHQMGMASREKAQREFDLALAGQPNNAFLLTLSGGPYARVGNLERAAAAFAREPPEDLESPD